MLSLSSSCPDCIANCYISDADARLCGPPSFPVISEVLLQGLCIYLVSLENGSILHEPDLVFVIAVPAAGQADGPR